MPAVVTLLAVDAKLAGVPPELRETRKSKEIISYLFHCLVDEVCVTECGKNKNRDVETRG